MGLGGFKLLKCFLYIIYNRITTNISSILICHTLFKTIKRIKLNIAPNIVGRGLNY